MRNLLIADLDFLRVRTRSGRRKNALQHPPPQGAVEPLKTEGAELTGPRRALRREPLGLWLLESVSPHRQQAVKARWTNRWMANKVLH